MTDHPLVADYLRRLERAAMHAPPDGRDILLEEIAAHLGATVPLNATDEHARQLLAAFGSPEDLVAEAFGRAPRPDPVTRRHRWLRSGVAAALLVAVAAVVLTLVIPTPTTSMSAMTGKAPTGAASAATSLTASLPQDGPRTTEGRIYAEYVREIDSLPALPTGATYPDGVPAYDAPTGPVVSETGIGTVIADFTWLCLWETEYLDAYDSEAFERLLDAEQALRSWRDLTPYPPEDVEAWAQNVLTPLEVDDPSGVRADRQQACQQAGIRTP